MSRAADRRGLGAPGALARAARRAAVVAFVVACAASAMFAGSARSAFAAPAAPAAPRAPAVAATSGPPAAPSAVAAPGAPAAPAAPDCAKAKPQRRAFFVRHRPLAEAAQLVESKLGPCGAYTVARPAGSIVVTDEPESLRAIAEALAAWDKPRARIAFSLRLVAASVASSAPVPPPIPGVSETLARLTRYSRFEELGTARVEATEGAEVETALGPRHRVRLRLGGFDAERGVARVAPFELFEVGPEGTAPCCFFSLSLNLPAGRANLVGAPARGGETALFVALDASPAGR